MQAVERRRTPVQSWYLDLSLHARLWDTEHIYHHTSPVLNIFALREALRIIVEEGVDERLARHCLHASALGAGLSALGLQQFADPAHRMPSVTTVLAPPRVSAAAVRLMLLEKFNLEIAGGLGDYADRMWRIGIMGHSAQRANVVLLLAALEQVVRHHGFEPPASGTAAAEAVYTPTLSQS
jgi:alanine-glyoxylate transaminase/serine-glyoxylate transaminase/serine-pyruvate transaminase